MQSRFLPSLKCVHYIQCTMYQHARNFSRSKTRTCIAVTVTHSLSPARFMVVISFDGKSIGYQNRYRATYLFSSSSSFSFVCFCVTGNQMSGVNMNSAALTATPKKNIYRRAKENKIEWLSPLLKTESKTKWLSRLLTIQVQYMLFYRTLVKVFVQLMSFNKTKNSTKFSWRQLWNSMVFIHNNRISVKIYNKIDWLIISKKKKKMEQNWEIRYTCTVLYYTVTV